MSSLLLRILLVSNLQVISALFIVTPEKMKYTARYGDMVKLICNFPVTNNFEESKLKASWEYINPSSGQQVEILRLNNGKIELLDVERTSEGRIAMSLSELKNGHAVLEITNVTLTDAGNYRCVLQLEGADYGTITLDVQASYKNIRNYTAISSDGNDIYLTCQALGFPEAEVFWKNNDIDMCFPPNTSHKLTAEGFYNTSSIIKCRKDSIQNLKCQFWNKALNETTEAVFRFEGDRTLTL
uniref:Programmed cell death 1 ligand 2 n=1 Tax=Leptobrachium leishanense TaxID=445787 RepID=A0A8C5LRY0_9ANUR